MVLECVEKLEKSKKASSSKANPRFLFRGFARGKRCGKLCVFVERCECAEGLWKFLKRCAVEKEKMCKEMWKREKTEEKQILRELKGAKRSVRTGRKNGLRFENVEKRNDFQQSKKFAAARRFCFFHLFFHNLWKSKEVGNFQMTFPFSQTSHQANSLQILLISYSKALSPFILLLITSMEERMVV